MCTANQVRDKVDTSNPMPPVWTNFRLRSHIKLNHIPLPTKLVPSLAAVLLENKTHVLTRDPTDHDAHKRSKRPDAYRQRCRASGHDAYERCAGFLG